MNNEKLKSIWEKAKTVVKKVSKKVWIIAAAVLVALIALVVILNIVRGSRSYTMLFTGLSASDVSGIQSSFSEWNVTDYQMRNGDTIYVRSNMEHSLRARLLEAGYPSQGFSYSSDEYFSKVGALSTEAERNKAWQEYVRGDMADTIASFENVRAAKVYLNPGQDSTYVLDYSTLKPASASVIVEMANGKTLTDGQVTAIRNLVAYGAEGMQMDTSAVSVEDTFGNSYSMAGNDSFDGAASALKLQLEEQYQNKIRTQIMQILVPLYGEENVRTTVNCVVEVSQSTVNSHEVVLPDWAQDGSTYGGGTIGSVIWNGSFVRNLDETTGGVVGTTTNSDFWTYVEDLTDPDNGIQQAEGGGQIDMDNTTVDTYTVRSAAYISDLSVSVVINSTTAGLVDTDETRNSVAKAAGIVNPYDPEVMTTEEYQDSKIAVVVQPFYAPEANNPEAPGDNNGLFAGIPQWILLAAAGGLLLFIILLIVVLLILKKKKKKKLQKQIEEEAKTAELLASVGITAEAGLEPELEGADVMSLQTERSMELRQDIRKFVDENPEVAAQLVKGWLRGDDENG